VSISRAAAVVRLSSLGDVLLAAHVPSFLVHATPGRRVLFVTKERYAEILRGHPHVARVVPVREEEGLEPAIEALRGEDLGEIVDLHRNWRSARILASFPGTPRRLAPKDAFRRRLWVYARWLRPAPVPPLLRTYRAVSGVDPSTELTPWLRMALSDAERSSGWERVPRQGFVLLGAGARWTTKRWPAAHFAALAQTLDRDRGIPSLIALEPGEEVAPELRAYPVIQAPFRELAAAASHALAIVSNDSAILHLGPALGVPAVGIFGGTVPELGFARQGPRDEAVGIELHCRPCGVHGRARCPLGHHACMRDLSPSLVVETLGRALA
jgi:heptosyltransferase-2